MNKDIIYIDVEDDITAIVGKITASKQRIIALVPPKRMGILQSAVNMRLLARAADKCDKRIVLITGDAALSGLAAAAHIPVAKTLQSKPELAEIPALKVDDEDDIIDGSALTAVGDMAEEAPSERRDDARAAAVDEVAASEDRPKKKAVAARKPAVPDFNIFRKRFVLIGGGVLASIGLLVWALVFAPRATVVITAKTTPVTIDKTVTLKPDSATDAKAAVVKVLRKEQQKELTVEFTPTGRKRVGERASGTMKLRRTSVSSNALTIPSGTAFSSGDYTFVSTETATLSGTTVGPNGFVQDTATVRVQATSIGEEYNLSARSYASNVGGFSAAGSAMSGGSSREVTVPTTDDVAKAREKLSEQKADDLRKTLTDSMPSSSVVIAESYTEQRGEGTPSVAVDQEASGSVQLKATVTASLSSIDKADLKQFLEQMANQEISGKKHQKIYGDGADGVRFAQFAEQGGVVTVRLTANATVGPEISEAMVKQQAKGRSYGDVQSSLESIEGVKDVDTKFWPFWVRTVPGDEAKINVEFKLENGN